MEGSKTENPMGKEDIGPLLLKMAIPAILSMLIQSLYNITDSYFVAKLSEKAFRATSISFPIQTILVGFGVGIGIGLNSYISRALGAGDEKRANKAAMQGLVLILLAWSLFIVFRVFFMNSFIGTFTEDLQVADLTREYLGLVTTFSVFAITQMTLEKTIQGTGNMIMPMIIQLTGAIINIILDPILIFGLLGFPKMGISGAAIATLIGQGMGAGLGVFYILSDKSPLSLDFRNFKISFRIIKDISDVALPTIMMNGISAFVNIVMNIILVAHSEMAISVLGIYFKLQSFVFMPVFGLSQGLMPIIGFNYGAGNPKRVKEAKSFAMKFCLIIMGVGLLVFQVFPRHLINVFAEDALILEQGEYALRIISLSFMFAGVGIINSTFFQALGLGKFSLLITTLRQVIFIIPLAYYLSKLGLSYIWFAYPLAEIVSVIISIFMERRVMKEYVDSCYNLI